MRGASVDLGALMSGQDKNITVGNTKTNARGDQLGRGGRVVKSAAEIARDHYNQNPPQAVVKSSIKTDDVATTVADAPIIEDDWVEPAAPSAPKTDSKDNDKVQWVEDEDGNFITEAEAKEKKKSKK